MGTVRAPALLGGLVDLDVLDDEVAGVEALGVGVGLGVAEKAEEEVGRLDGPAGLGDTELLAWEWVSDWHSVRLVDPRLLVGSYCRWVLLVGSSATPADPILHMCPRQAGQKSYRRTLGGAAGRAGVAAHGDGLSLRSDVLEEGQGTLQLPAVDGLGGLASVLEGHTEVGTAGAGRLRGRDLGGGVSNLHVATVSVPPYLCQLWFLVPLPARHVCQPKIFPYPRPRGPELKQAREAFRKCRIFDGCESMVGPGLGRALTIVIAG